MVTCDGGPSDSSDRFATVPDSGHSTIADDGCSELSGIGGTEVASVSFTAITDDNESTFPGNCPSAISGNCGAIVPGLDTLLVTDLVIGADGSYIPVMIYLFDLVLDIKGFFRASRSRERITAHLKNYHCVKPVE